MPHNLYPPPLVLTLPRCISPARHGGLKGKLIRIPIQIISGPKFELEIYSSDTVATLRQKVAEHIKKDPSLLRIITAGKELHNDNDTLQQARINDGHAVHIIHRVVKVLLLLLLDWPLKLMN